MVTDPESAERDRRNVIEFKQINSDIAFRRATTFEKRRVTLSWRATQHPEKDIPPDERGEFF